MQLFTCSILSIFIQRFAALVEIASVVLHTANLSRSPLTVCVFLHVYDYRETYPIYGARCCNEGSSSIFYLFILGLHSQNFFITRIALHFL